MVGPFQEVWVTLLQPVFVFLSQVVTAKDGHSAVSGVRWRLGRAGS